LAVGASCIATIALVAVAKWARLVGGEALLWSPFWTGRGACSEERIAVAQRRCFLLLIDGTFYTGSSF